MDRPGTSDPAGSALRRRAEARLGPVAAGADFIHSDAECRARVHELELHRIELDMQCQELAASNRELQVQREEAETRLSELRKPYLALSQTNRAILGLREERALLRRICDIALESDDYVLAWIGLDDPDHRTLTVAASSGSARGCLEGPEATGETGSPIGWPAVVTALGEGRPAVFQGPEGDPDSRAWAEWAAARGIGSCAAFPISRSGRVAGVLCLGSRRSRGFHPDSLALLAEISDGLSAALAGFDREAALMASEQRFSRIFQLSPDAIDLSGLETGIIYHHNHSFEKLYGYSAGEVNGRSTLPGGLGILTLEDRARHLAELKATGEAKDFEVSLRRKDGSRFPALLSSSLLEIGGERFNISIARDISEAKKAQESLRLSEERLRLSQERLNLALASAGMGAFEWDIQTDQRHWDATARHLLSGDSGQGAESTEAFVGLIHPEDRQLVRNSLGWAKEHGDYQVEYRVVWPDGSVHHLAARGRIFPDDRGRPDRLIGFVLDVTEQRQAEQQLLQLNEDLEGRIHRRTALLETANAELDAFSYSVSHDLRAPLRGIDGFSLALLEDCGDQLSGEGQHYLARVRAGVQHMGQLIDDLLKLSRSTRAPLNRRRLDLSAMARAVLETLRQGDPSRCVELQVEDGLWADGDPGLLHSVLENLLGNAWKYSAKVPVARIRFGGEARPDGTVVFCVRDNGAGFDMAYAAKLFGAFQRLHSPNEFEGSGIGLAIVQRILHRHGGRVWAEAEVGQGARFFFQLPP
jgi:PAS domain S-box-containing protein